MDYKSEISITSWNVNSVRARLELVLSLIKEDNPDVILLQETKVINELFPREYFEEYGYNIALCGQKTYNGVAILSKFPVENIEISTFSNEARIVSCFSRGINFISVYVINGQEVGSPKYYEKLDFMDYLNNLLLHKASENTLIAGDFNITFDDNDVYNPKLWRNRITCSDAEREKLHNTLSVGYEDKFRSFNTLNTYTWWDYRHNSLSNNHGLRLDYILASKSLARKISNISVKKSMRAFPKTSDHAPIQAVIAI